MATDDSSLYRNVHFLLSANQLRQLPADNCLEIAFVGRSNVGKSSALNCLLNRKQLAKTSKTPGRTQLINVFALDDLHYIIDLPGYGFAKVPEKIKLHWQKLLTQYFETRESLQGIFILMDIRHPLKPMDWQMLAWTQALNISSCILLTKADKLKTGKAKTTLKSVKEALSARFSGDIRVQLFSSLNKTGLAEARAQMREWLDL